VPNLHLNKMVLVLQIVNARYQLKLLNKKYVRSKN